MTYPSTGDTILRCEEEASHFELPPLPYAVTDLQPILSAETLQIHHGKHHARYVETLNRLLAEQNFTARTLEEVIRIAHGSGARGLFNNAAQAWNHSLWNGPPQLSDIGYDAGANREGRTMTIVMIGVDLGKNSCSVAALDEHGAVMLRRRMRPTSIADFAAKYAPCTVAMEACCGAHYLGRQLIARGLTVKLMPPEYVRPYVKAQKNDDRDAEAIAEAATRPTMRFVELKSQEQLDIQSLHRVRSRLVSSRTTLINQMRALLLERGVTIAQGRRKFERAIDVMLADEAALTPGRLRDLLLDMREEWTALDSRIGALDEEFVQLARTDEVARRLTSIPGVGALNATALVAAVGKAEAFEQARDLGAWLGLVPRQHTTGGKPRLLGISKRGNTYLRTLLIHGARAALPSLAKADTALGAWLRGLQARCHPNTVVVALANKLARIAWVLMRRDTVFATQRVAIA